MVKRTKEEDALQSMRYGFEEALKVVKSVFLSRIAKGSKTSIDQEIELEKLEAKREKLEADNGFVSMSSEILAQAVERFPDLNLRCRRVTALPTPIPSARPLEEKCLPSEEAIIRMARELAR